MENNAVFHVPFFISPRRRDKTSDGRRRAQRPNFASCPCAPAPGGGRAKPPGSSGEGMVSSFLCPVPRPPPPEGAGAKPPGGPEKRMVSNLCVFFTAWLPNGYQKIWETIGAVGTAKMVISVWLPNGYQGNFFERKGSLFSCFEAIFQLFWSMQGALYRAEWPKKSPKALKTGRKAPKTG